ncbi:hypothetical protein C8R44DRAFT_267071 [Mycena epipterygia]|nr:hypothetical protein C8R44DRAFT_267071 [Mycena epipterygia]
MDTGSAPAKRKVTVKVTESSSQPRNYATRSPSPYKSYTSAPSPTFRPKAKVNSSATSSLPSVRKATSVLSNSALSRSNSVKSAASSSRTGSTLSPRPASPSKQTPRARAPITRGLTAQSAPQESRQRSLTTTNSSPSYASRSPASSSGPTVSEILNLSDDDQDSPAPSPRITAKLSGRKSNEFPPSPVLPPNSSLRAQSHRARVPSISSNASSSASAPFPAAAPGAHRFPSARPSPPHQYYQPFPRDEAPAKYAARPNGFNAKVDPATIPLPPHSPPTSAVSFSSRSSLSASSTSYVTESGNSQLSVPRTGTRADAADANMRSGLANLMNLSGMLPSAADTGEDYSDDDDDDAQDQDDRENELRASTFERKIRAEAKSVRKIADLEITNRSLLAINTSLEQTKHRQAKEIRELRRKLRESRLILPPRAFRAVKSSLDHDDTADEEDDPEEEEEEGAVEKALEEHDVKYHRIKVILDGLLESGRRALETTPQDFPEPVKVAKVLAAYEVQSDDEEPREAVGSQIPASPSHVAVPDSDEDDFRSEDEVEAMTLPRDSPPPSPPPSPQPPVSAEPA